jgi:hypothetical protein
LSGITVNATLSENVCSSSGVMSFIGVDTVGTLLHTLLQYFAISCTPEKFNSFLFKRFRTLS